MELHLLLKSELKLRTSTHTFYRRVFDCQNKTNGLGFIKSVCPKHTKNKRKVS